MSFLHLFVIMATLTAGAGFITQVVFKLRGGLGMAVSGAGISLCAYLVGMVWPEAVTKTEALFQSINYAETVMKWMLAMLLFAGAMHVDLRSLLKWRRTVGLLATVGVVLSALIVAFAAYLVTQLIGLDIPWPWLLVFGAIISPTDPVAVLGLLKQLNAPKDLETKFSGESLLNDGTAIVLFSVFLAYALNPESLSLGGAALMFVSHVLGGLVLGAALGFAGHFLLKMVDDAPTAVVMTMAYALGGYTLGDVLHVSGPLVAAVMGLVIGHYRHSSMAGGMESQVVPFWDMMDSVLNQVLFLLVGLALITLPNDFLHIAFGIAAIVCALVGRLVSVALPMALDARTRALPVGTVQAMVWGGVRGGVSLAMVLALPESPYKSLLVTATWAVVMFSLLVQVPTMGKVLRHYRLIPGEDAHDAAPGERHDA